ncbi:MAG: ABC transporter permease, partial [Gemmatimonadota bacterium]
VANALLLRPLPGIDGQEQVVDLGRAHARYGGHDSFTWPDFRDIREGVSALEDAAAVRMAPMSLSREEAGEMVHGAFVTPSYFTVLGVEAERGRLFGSEAEAGVGEHPVAVLGLDFWEERLGADPGVMGSTVLLNRQPYTVVGVAERGFRSHAIGIGVDVFLPIVQFPAMSEGRNEFDARGAAWFQALGRIAPGASLETLRLQLDDLAGRLAEAYPETNAERTFAAVPLGPIPGAGRGPATAFLGVLTALVVIILLVTCANVAGMFLARALSREKEIAVRLALGSGRRRLVRQLLSESLIVFVLGGAAGVAVAWWGVSALSLEQLPLPGVELELDFAPDGRVLVLSAAATLLTGFVFGLLPALGATRLELVPSLKDEGGLGGGRGRVLRRAFVGAQVGLSLVLLVGAGLFLRSLQEAGRMTQGFDPGDAWMTMLDLSLEGYDTE